MCDFVLFAVLFLVLFGVLLFVLMIVLLGVLCFVLMIVLFGVLLFVLMTHGSPARTAHLIPPNKPRPRARSTAQRAPGQEAAVSEKYTCQGTSRTCFSESS